MKLNLIENKYESLNSNLTFHTNLQRKINQTIFRSSLNMNSNNNNKILLPTKFEDISSLSQRNSILIYYQKFKGCITCQNMSNSPIYVCNPNENTNYHFFINRIWIWIDMFLFSLIPFLVMAICSYIILIDIKNKSRNFLTSNDRNNAKILVKSRQRNRQLLIMLTVTNIVFLFCSLPLCVSIIIDKIGVNKNDTNLYLSIFQIFSYLNNSLNFVFYFTFCENYRNALTNLMCKLTKRPINETISTNPIKSTDLNNLEVKQKRKHLITNI